MTMMVMRMDDREMKAAEKQARTHALQTSRDDNGEDEEDDNDDDDDENGRQGDEGR